MTVAGWTLGLTWILVGREVAKNASQFKRLLPWSFVWAIEKEREREKIGS